MILSPEMITLYPLNIDILENYYKMLRHKRLIIKEIKENIL